MTAGLEHSEPRLEELLAAEAADGLDRDEALELEQLLARTELPERGDFVRVAALVQTAFLRRDAGGLQRMPTDLHARLQQQAAEFFDNRTAQNDSAGVADMDTAREKKAARRRWLNPGNMGWLVAAGLALAFVVFRAGPPGMMSPDQAPDIAARRAALLKEPETLVLPWIPSSEPGYENVSGDVVWNNESQQGYLRIAGMPANDAQRMQYQLWIVDPARDEKPVDGGVFDITATAGEVIVPIDAKLPVSSPRAFAITAEQPGGVVVSDGPLLVVAPLTG